MSDTATEDGVVARMPRDHRYAPSGRIYALDGYDAGRPPPPRPDDSPGSDLLAAGIDEVVEALASQLGPIMPGDVRNRQRWIRHLHRVLEWLAEYPGDTWEQRWLASGADEAPRAWAHQLEEDGRVTRSVDGHGALTALVIARLVRPSYTFMLSTIFRELPQRFSLFNDPDMFDRLRALPSYSAQVRRVQLDAETCLARIMIRTGKPLGAVTGDDLLAYADMVRASGRIRREHLAWELMVELGPFADEPPTLRAVWSAKGNTRQHTTAGLVDRYGLPPSPVRDLLIDYVDEIRPSVDYSTLEHITHHLARLFWWTILQINPAQQDLRLSPEVVAAWRERLAVTSKGKPRGDFHGILFTVRAFYHDIAHWALEDPARWARWAAPSPVRAADVRALQKTRNRVKARMQKRTRVLTGLLDQFTTTALDRKRWSAELLQAAKNAAHDEEFTVDGITYRRHDPPLTATRNQRSRTWVAGPADIANKSGLIDTSKLELDCFWAWALIETLRLTGARIEEVLELTQLSIRHYTPASTGTLVPLLHIAPSKIDIERLIPMSPELVEVLVAVQRRAKAGRERVPLSVRYDHHERLHGEPLPHLFARPVGARHEVLSTNFVRTILNATAEAAGITADGEPVVFTPHDFRRLFTTDAVGSGLPLHIVASLLGHLDLDTTRSYAAVFDDEVIAHHQKFITHRRTLRQSVEYRDATAGEWREFEQHFLLRRVELGDCFRPYGTPCIHEHACVRCPFLRLDRAQLPRLDDMAANARDRLDQAHERQWLGEVEALQQTLRHIDTKRQQIAPASS
ncbi:phage integrase family protein [Nocardia speluncae]|uniref:Phage integrase family protein n=1 Tax=Nocardia speluncae TaxID=419477 RepID=A0A846XLM3_9NOCA|nr:tyrosine-type recombinase/integrase [Nocardia speluncae]NKY35546.1 phage integrase family protein [Nocardia speluncae]